MEIALLSGLLGILGGIVSGLIVSILSQRKNNAEIKRLEAETKKINIELENIQRSEYKEILSNIHTYSHILWGAAVDLSRPERRWPNLDDKSDEYLSSLLEGELSKFELKEILRVPDKTEFYIETTLWHEYMKLEEARLKFHNYIVEKGIFLENEDFINTCEELDTVFEIFLRIAYSDFKKFSRNNLAPVLYNEFKTHIEPVARKIDEFIRSEIIRK